MHLMYQWYMSRQVRREEGRAGRVRRVVGQRKGPLRVDLGVEAGRERRHLALVVPLVTGVAQQRFDLPDRVRALLVERVDVARDPGLEVVDDELDEPPRLGGLRRDALAGHDQPGCA